MYKISDTVKIRRDLEVGKDYGDCAFVSKMLPKLGTKVKIKIVTSKPHWRRKYKQVKSRYLNPKLIQARAEKRQQEKRNNRLKKLIQKNMQYDFRTKEQLHIDRTIACYEKIPVEKLEDFTLSIVRINKPDTFGVVRDHIEVVCFPDKMLKHGHFYIFTEPTAEMQKCVLIKTLQ